MEFSGGASHWAAGSAGINTGAPRRRERLAELKIKKLYTVKTL